MRTSRRRDVSVGKPADRHGYNSWRIRMKKRFPQHSDRLGNRIDSSCVPSHAQRSDIWRRLRKVNMNSDIIQGSGFPPVFKVGIGKRRPSFALCP